MTVYLGKLAENYLFTMRLLLCVIRVAFVIYEDRRWDIDFRLIIKISIR